MPRFLKQTIFGDKKGNCFAACVASLLGRSLDEVPNFCTKYPAVEWWDKFRDWLHEQGYEAIFLEFKENNWDGAWKMMFTEADGLMWIASGKSPRGDFLHSTVYKGAKLFFDPHPDNGGIDSDPKDCVLLIPYDPILQLCKKTMYC